MRGKAKARKATARKTTARKATSRKANGVKRGDSVPFTLENWDKEDFEFSKTNCPAEADVCPLPPWSV